MKDLLLQIINNDTTYNKSATRYLYRSHPKLWEQIIDLTKFLPEDAKPKQRIWHILNDIYERPVCPITNIYVKWFENRYLKTINVNAARIKQYRDGKASIHDSEVRTKAIKSIRRTISEGRRKPPTLTDEILQQRTKKAKQTCLDRYGVPNGGQSQIARKKVSNARIRNGATPHHLRSLKRLYYDAVWKFTKQNWKKYFDQINPDRINRSKNALDHIYSIQQGFRDSIPPYIIGHYTNLRVISLSENSTKGMRCDKTKEQLFDDFFACIDDRLTLI